MSWNENSEHPVPFFIDATTAGSPHPLSSSKQRVSWWVISNDSGTGALVTVQNVGGGNQFKLSIPGKSTIPLPGFVSDGTTGLELVVTGANLFITFGFPLLPNDLES